MDPRIGVLRAGLEQQHRIPAVRAQAVGEHASGRAGTDNDVVELVCAVIGMHQRPAVHSKGIIENVVAGEGHATTSLLAAKSNEFNSLIAKGVRI
jgi:hypothetical protein